MSWGAIAAHLQRVMDNTPPTYKFMLKDPCACRYIRLLDIAKYLRLEYTHLTRLRRGERLTVKYQTRLSWFFHAQQAGRIAKEQAPDGTWHIVYHHPQPQAHPDEARPGEAGPTRALPKIIFTADGIRLKL